MTPKTILAAVDQFPQSDPVLARALAIAATHGAALEIVHVIDIAAPDGDLARADTLLGQAAIAARDRIDAALLRLQADLSEIDIRIVAGSPALQLIDICTQTPPDLIVMRAHQREAISEKILGSTSDRVVTAGVAPVLIVKRSDARGHERVVLATNGSDAAGAALTFTAALLPDAALHLVQVVRIAPQLAEAMLRVGTDQGTLAAHRDTLSEQARAQLRDLSAAAPRPVTTEVLDGDPAVELTRAARNPQIDLIVLGAGRTSLIRRAFIGSVTRRLLRDADCDVLVYHPSDA